MNIGLVLTTLGREQGLRRLLQSVIGQVALGDIIVATSPLGTSRGRNAGVEALPEGVDYLLHFPNDATWFPPGAVAGIRSLPPVASAGALTVTDENGPKFRIPVPSTLLDRWNVWTVIKMGLVIRRSVFTELGGFTDSIGTEASTPWQSGDVVCHEYGSNASAFMPAFAPKYPGSFTHSSTRVPRPVFAANAIVGTSPADDTRFGSLKDADKDR